MIQLIEDLWIGDSADGDDPGLKVDTVLNVAQDLRTKCCWPDVEYAQVGLVDGPGNPLCAYASAVLALAGMMGRGRTMVCCHTGSRSVAVAVMYLNTTGGRSWNEWFDLLRERVDADLPVPHAAHRAAFDRMDWRSITNLIWGRRVT